MGWIWREKPDGARGLAYPVYLGGLIAVLGVIWALHRRISVELPAPGFHARNRGAEVRVITRASAAALPVEQTVAESAPESHSYRLKPFGGASGHPRRHEHASKEARAVNPPPAESGEGTTGADFDAIGEALHPSNKNRLALPKEQFASLPPALPPTARGESDEDTERLPRPQLLSYRDASADGPATAEPTAAAASHAPWLARGSLLPVYLLTTVDTSNPAALLQFALSDDVTAHRRSRLRFATRFLGRLSGRPLRDRLSLTVDTVLYSDGRQLPLQASAVEANDEGADIRPGIAAAYYPPPPSVQLAPYASDFATGFLGLLQSRAQQGFAVGVGGLNLTTAVPEDAKAPAWQASSQAIGDFTRARLHEWEDRYAAYYQIPAGTPCWLQLEADFAGDLHAHQ